jgi:hypothetical protein
MMKSSKNAATRTPLMLPMFQLFPVRQQASSAEARHTSSPQTDQDFCGPRVRTTSDQSQDTNKQFLTF